MIVTTIRDYFWPNPPKRISAESQAAMKADSKDKGTWPIDLDDKHRQSVSVWTRQADNLARAENRKWLRTHGAKFVRRWVVVSGASWVSGWAVSGTALEVPLVLVGFAAGVLAVFFLYQRNLQVMD
ncbi:MAG: hypothetical protein ACREPQ_14225 [Rhodanobacter sp.]